MHCLLSLVSLFGALAVLAGAFGAHALKAILTPEALVWWGTAVEYHFYHTLLSLVYGVLALLVEKPLEKSLCYASYLALLGVLLFSGSLYLLALTGWMSFTLLTPLGGLCFCLAWVLPIWSFAKHSKNMTLKQKSSNNRV